MKGKTFLILTVLTVIISEIVHPPMEKWIGVTIYCCGIGVYELVLCIIAAIRKNKEVAIERGCMSLFFFWMYLIISVIAFLRLFDDIMSKPLLEKLTILFFGVCFIIFAIWILKKNGILANDEDKL